MRTIRRPISTLALVLGLVALPNQGRAAPPDEVRARARKAAAAIADGKLEQADAIIARNLESDPDPFLYLLGVLRERQGDCEAATDAYRRYMELEVADEDVAAAQAGVDACAEADAQTDAQTDNRSAAGSANEADVGAGTEGGTEVGPGPGGDGGPETPDRRWWVDPVGLGLTVGGGALLIAGGVTWSQTGAQSRAAEDAGSLSTYERHGRRAEILQGVGIALVSVGAALVVGGAIRYGIVASRGKRSESAAVRLRATPGGLALVF